MALHLRAQTCTIPSDIHKRYTHEECLSCKTQKCSLSHLLFHCPKHKEKQQELQEKIKHILTEEEILTMHIEPTSTQTEWLISCEQYEDTKNAQLLYVTTDTIYEILKNLE